MLGSWILLHNIRNIRSDWGLRVHLCSSLGILIDHVVVFDLIVISTYWMRSLAEARYSPYLSGISKWVNKCGKWRFLCLLNEYLSDFKWPLPSALTVYCFHNGRCVDIMWKSHNSSNNWFVLIMHSVLFPEQGKMPIWHDCRLNKEEARARCVLVRWRDARGQLPAVGNLRRCLFSRCGTVRIYL